MKAVLTLAVALIAALMLSSVVFAQDPVPPPFAGLENPFAWDDEATLNAGEPVYKARCQGCHASDGSGMSAADFSTEEFPRHLRENADFYFWITSEGRAARGMPAFADQLTENEIWQVLTLIGTLAEQSTGGSGLDPNSDPGGLIHLTLPANARSGEPFTVEVTLFGSDFEALGNATVTFSQQTEFFIEAPMVIGQAITNRSGQALVELVVTDTGSLDIIASFGEVEAVGKLVVAEGIKSENGAHIGLHLPEMYDDIVFGPEAATHLDENSNAPVSQFRIPGGMRGFLFLAYLFAVILVWSLYLRVWYQLLRIPKDVPIQKERLTLVPYFGLAVMTGFLILLIFVLINGPQSHFHVLN